MIKSVKMPTHLNVNKVFGTQQHNRVSKKAMLASLNDDAQKTKRIVHVWTDGSCYNNGKRNSYGGWATIMQMVKDDGTLHKREFLGGDKPTTNNRMELMAVLIGLHKLRKSSKVVIHTDSKYLRNGICLWIHNWIKNGWITSEGTPVKNKDLWIRLLSLITHHTVAFVWKKGKTDAHNLRADYLAKRAMDMAGKDEMILGRCHALEQFPSLVAG